MNTFDYRGLDADILEAITTIYEEQSVSRAATRLAVSQSTLSHRLDRARKILRDPLFVRSGRGIKATENLLGMMPTITDLTFGMKLLLSPVEIDAGTLEGEITIASSDYERRVLLFDACENMLALAPNISFRFNWEQFDNSNALRRGEFNLAVAPYGGALESAEILHEPLFQDELCCFYDESVTSPPTSLEDYLSRKHLTVMLSKYDQSFTDMTLRQMGLSRNIKIVLPCVSDVPSILSGTNYIATLPAKSHSTIMQGFAKSPPPLKIPSVHYGMFWHIGTDTSPKHKWVRSFLTRYVSETMPH